MNVILGTHLSFFLYGAVAWGLLAAMKFGLTAAFGWSPFDASGTEILLGAILLYIASVETDRVVSGRS